MNLIKPSSARAVADRISHAIRSGMVGDCQLPEKTIMQALDDREAIMERTNSLNKKLSFGEARARAQTEFAESVILGFLKSKELLEPKKPKEESEKNAEICSDPGAEGGERQEEETGTSVQQPVESGS